MDPSPSNAPNPTPGMQSPQVQNVSSPAYPPATAPTIVIQQKDSRFSRWFSWLGWMGLMLCLPFLFGLMAKRQEYYDVSGGIMERFVSGNELADAKIAIIDVSGVILEGEGFVKNQIQRIRRDPDVKGIVLRIDSPGGTVTGSDFLYHHLSKLRTEKSLPMVVSMGSIAASGGYYIAMAVGDQSQCIYAEPTTTTGSIGVIIPHYDVSGLMERLDVKDDSIASHPRKQLLSMTRRASDEDREVLRSYVMQSFDRFKEIVRAGRPAFREHPERLDELATGEIFTAPVAKQRGLVDEIGFLEDAIERVADMANVDIDNVRVVRYKKQPTFWEAMGVMQVTGTELETSPWSWAIPRAYYLWTSLPLLISSHVPQW